LDVARILVVLALLLTAFEHSFAQPAFSASPTLAVIGNAACNDFQTLAISGGGTAIPFTVAIDYAAEDTNTNWLYATVPGIGSTTLGAFSANTGANGAQLAIGLNSALGAISDIAEVILTPTNFATFTPVNIALTAASALRMELVRRLLDRYQSPQCLQ
jgi:hypothetical protein